MILFVTLCDMDFKQLRITPLHLWLLGFQLVVGASMFFIFLPINDTLAQGAMMGMLAPTAVSATVVAVILGANMATMVTYTILYNLVLAFIAPFVFSLIGFHSEIPFWTSCFQILRKVSPLIVLPLVMSFVFQRFLPKTTKIIIKSKMLPFYLWAATLTVVIGQTMDYVIIQEHSKIGIIVSLAGIAFVQCVLQFGFGRWIGAKYGDTIAGGQAVGQKNGVLAVWMTQTYLDPLASVVPAAYIIWQNLWNSYQMLRKKD